MPAMLGNLVVILILILLCGLAIRSILRSRKAGKHCGCSGGCGGCNGSCDRCLSHCGRRSSDSRRTK